MFIVKSPEQLGNTRWAENKFEVFMQNAYNYIAMPKQFSFSAVVPLHQCLSTDNPNIWMTLITHVSKCQVTLEGKVLPVVSHGLVPMKHVCHPQGIRRLELLQLSLSFWLTEL